MQVSTNIQYYTHLVVHILNFPKRIIHQKNNEKSTEQFHFYFNIILELCSLKVKVLLVLWAFNFCEKSEFVRGEMKVSKNSLKKNWLVQRWIPLLSLLPIKEWNEIYVLSCVQSMICETKILQNHQLLLKKFFLHAFIDVTLSKFQYEWWKDLFFI